MLDNVKEVSAPEEVEEAKEEANVPVEEAPVEEVNEQSERIGEVEEEVVELTKEEKLATVDGVFEDLDVLVRGNNTEMKDAMKKLDNAKVAIKNLL